jgi:hypothetical protein
MVSGKFSELLDELPVAVKEFIDRFLKENAFVKLLEKSTRFLKKFSFSLRKTSFEQRFKNFCGSSNFIKQNEQRFLS